jgi:hypothetical protein
VDLFLTVAVSAGRKIGLRLVRRVLTFPSGFLGEFDLYFFVNVRSGLGGRGGFLVGRREDAEGDRYAGFKIQIGDSLTAAKRQFSST